MYPSTRTKRSAYTSQRPGSNRSPSPSATIRIKAPEQSSAAILRTSPSFGTSPEKQLSSSCQASCSQVLANDQFQFLSSRCGHGSTVCNQCMRQGRPALAASRCRHLLHRSGHDSYSVLRVLNQVSNDLV